MAIKPKRGGKRPGAGRKRGVRDRATGEQRASLQDLARLDTALALATLRRVAQGSESDAAAVSAANAILDRGYGRPPQAVSHTGNIGTYDLTNASDDDVRALEAILARIAKPGSGEGGDS
jgi:hypothetical protein